MSAPQLDTALIRHRRAELGLSVRAVASVLGVTGTRYTAIESGLGNLGIDLGTLVRLRDSLGLSVAELIASTTDSSDEVAADVAVDVKTLGALLLTLGELTLVGTLMEVLGWSLERLRAAEAALSEQLEAVGMRINRSNARLAIVPADSAVDAAARRRAVRQGMARNHVGLTEARVLRHVLAGNVPTQPSNPERVAQGVLVNAGLVAPGPALHAQVEKPLVLSDDARFSLMLNEDPCDDDTSTPRNRRSRVTVAGNKREDATS
jgi:transcriptional regulator with XRE-family HTH domain